MTGVGKSIKIRKNDKPSPVYFEVVSKIGAKVRTTKSYWNVIIKLKHPIVKGREDEVKGALREPDMIRISKSDGEVFLFYKKINKHYMAVVVRRLNKNESFIITSYITSKVLEGKQIWPK